MARCIQSKIERKTVDAAIRILGGEKPGDIKFEPIGFASPKYDWREIQRWGISESNLPGEARSCFVSPASGKDIVGSWR